MNSVDIQLAIDVVRSSILLAIKLSFLPLFVGLIVGLLMTVIQTLTQLQEQTLALIPKMFAVIATVFFIVPWLLNMLLDYTSNLFTDMVNWF